MERTRLRLRSALRFGSFYLEKYKDPIIKILLVAAVISLGLAAIHGEYVETIGIILAIVLATTIGFWFEMDAAKKFNVLTALGEESPVKVSARRQGGRDREERRRRGRRSHNRGG